MRVTKFQYPMEVKMAQKLDIMIDRCTGKNKMDNLLINDGGEGMGKTTMSLCQAVYLAEKTGRPFNVKNVFFDLDTMITFAMQTEAQIILWDEAALGGLSTEGYNKMQIKLIKLLMVARKKRHIYIFNIPSAFKLKEYIVERAIGLCHVYLRNEVQHGRFVYYKKSAKDGLYHKWKNSKKRLYSKYVTFRGTFPDILDPKKSYNILSEFDVDEYERKKDEAILSINKEDESKSASAIKRKFVQETIKRWMKNGFGLTQKDMAFILGLPEQTMSRFCIQIRAISKENTESQAQVINNLGYNQMDEDEIAIKEKPQENLLLIAPMKHETLPTN